MLANNKYFGIIFLCLLLIGISCSVKRIQSEKLNNYKLEGFAQGTSYQISYYASDAVIATKAINTLFAELDSSLSIYKPYSLISQFNNSEKGIEMDHHLFKVVHKSLKIWKESDGVFDISILPIVETWGFGTKKHSYIPSDKAIKTAVACSGSDKIRIKGNKLIKDIPCLKIDVNGIAQGYSVDVIAQYIESKGVQNYLVEVGGEIRVKGRKYPGGKLMQIGIEQASENSMEGSVIQKVLPMSGGAITTSGNYRKFIQNGSKKLSHLMDPKTGRPIDNEMISVTVRAKDAMSADGYDNVLIGMGIEKAFAFLKKHKGLEAFFIYQKEDGSVVDTASAGFFR